MRIVFIVASGILGQALGDSAQPSWACVVGVRGVQDPRMLRADSTRVGWAYAQNTPNNGSRAAVFEHEIGRRRVRSLFTKQLLYH